MRQFEYVQVREVAPADTDLTSISQTEPLPDHDSQ